MKIIFTAMALAMISHCFGQQSPIGTLSRETGFLLKDDVTRMLIHNSSGDRAYDYVRQISMWDRANYEQNYSEAANWVRAKAQEFGLSDVDIETYPADGKAEYFGFTPSLPWSVKKAELWALAPYSFKITSYDDLPMSLAVNSASIDTTAELIEVRNGLDERDYEGIDVKNKVVLTDQAPNAVARIAVLQKGALGVVSSFAVPPWDYANRLPGDFPDQVGWTSVEGDKGIFAFVISERKRRELRSILSRGEKIVLKVTVETETKPGSIKVVSGVIKGSKFPDEEIVITAHLDHYKPGANDNASGSSVALEMARTLNYLVATKQIPPPLRTIRFLWVPEFDGTKAWFSRHAREPIKRIVNLNFDMLGADLAEVNANFSVNYTPDWNGHFINALSESVMDFINKYNNTRYARRKDYAINSVNGSRNPARGKMEAYARGSDHQIFNDFGIAGIAFSTWPDDNYHTSQDGPDHVDPTQLHRVAFGGLSLITTCAYATDGNAEALLAQVYAYGVKRLGVDERKALNQLYSSTSADLKVNAYLANAILQNAFDREEKSLMSCEAVLKNASKQIAKYQGLLNQRKNLVMQNTKEAAASLAKNLNVALAGKQAIEADENKYATFVPERLKNQELVSYSDARAIAISDYTSNISVLENEVTKKLQELREQEVGELTIYDFYNAMASYANGKRTIVDIRNAVYAEYGALFSLQSIETLFRVFEAAKAISVKTKN